MKYEDLNQLLKNRASHRKFQKDPVSDTEIEKMMTAAGLAPSGHNFQPWQFIVVRNHEVIVAMAKSVENKLQQLYKNLQDDFVRKLESYQFFMLHFKEAPVVIAALTRKFEYEPTDLIKNHFKEKKPLIEYSNIEEIGNTPANPAAKHFDMELLGMGAAINNLLLAAQSLGYASCWMVEPAVYAQQELESVLKVTEPWNLISVIPVGKPVKDKQGAARKPVHEIYSVLD